MIKTAVFVEGQTELIFIREYLLKMFDYQNIWVECYTLFNDGNHNPTEYSFPNETAAYYFQIINVGNDNAVLTRLLRREQYLWNSGFHQIFAIRDMYSKDYREIAKNSVIDTAINERFIQSAQQILHSKAFKPESIHFHFAIMEAEAWILGMKSIFTHLHADLTPDYIKENLNINLENDPETTYFHPAKTIESIYELTGKGYNKSKGDINAIMSHVSKNDFINLCQSGNCHSFNNVHNSLIPN